MTDGWEIYECRRPEDVFDAHLDGARQIFVADDAFGSTEFRPDQAQEWGDEMDASCTASTPSICSYGPRGRPSSELPWSECTFKGKRMRFPMQAKYRSTSRA
jgi:hypothetical protein